MHTLQQGPPAVKMVSMQLLKLCSPFTLVVLLCTSCVHSSPFLAKEESFLARQVQVDTLSRTFYVYLPKNTAAEKRPVLLAYHGAGGTALGLEKISGLSTLAEEKGFVLVYPEGINNRWNDGRANHNSDIADTAFFDAILQTIKGEFKIDPARVYVTGMSNGGLFSFRLACERSNQIAAIAPVVANLGADLSKQCKPSRPLSVLQIVGENDPLMHTEGGQITGPFGAKKLGLALSAKETLGFWTKANGCSAKALAHEVGKTGADGTSVEQTTFACAQGTQVSQVIIHGGGHTWPKGWQYMKAWIIGKTSQQLDANRAIWNFVSAHSLSSANK